MKLHNGNDVDIFEGQLDPSQISCLACCVRQVLRQHERRAPKGKLRDKIEQEKFPELKENWELNLEKMVNDSVILPSYSELEKNHCLILETLIDYYTEYQRV